MCGLYFHLGCTGTTDQVYICQHCLHSSDDELPELPEVNREKDWLKPPPKDSKVDYSNPDNLFEFHFKPSDMKLVDSENFGPRTVELANYINNKCITDFACPLPNLIIKFYSHCILRDTMVGCYLPSLHCTIICVKEVNDMEEILAILIHEFGHALDFNVGGADTAPHGKSWMMHTKNVFHSVNIRISKIDTICATKVDLKKKSRCIFTAKSS